MVFRLTVLYVNELLTRLAERSTKMKKYVCNVCGYVYDPAEGDPDNGVAAGTAWEDVPEEWVCPLCSAPKEDFSEE